MHFELVHTHPVIELDADGLLEKIVQSETKRGVCALPFETYEKFMAAYRLWTSLVEETRFVCNFAWPEHTVIAMNNYRVLHGRALVPPGMDRTMCFGYVQRTIFENRYRLLRQRQVEKCDPDMSEKWVTRLPNQVLQALVR
uniref:TauD/TfdA-like domain-containing protein n=1 Tax=Alexandrium andersonii TaxID=327968 RepID=A0A7S2AZT8_9DINO